MQAHLFLSLQAHLFAKEPAISYNNRVKQVQFEDQSTWDKKKIFIFLIFVILIIGIGYKALEKQSFNNLGVKGVTIQQDQNGLSVSQDESSSPTFKKTLEQKVDSIKEDVESLNVIDVATSTPAVQKIINDIKRLQDYPSSQAKEACLNICSNL